jgi:hypothetical protein
MDLANLGSESETCVGSRVRLVGAFISFEKNFYRLPFTPTLSGSPYRSFKWYQSRFGSLLTLTSLRSKDGVQERGSGPPHFDGKNYQMWSKRMAAFLRGKGQVLWDVTVDNSYVQSMNFLTPTIRRSTTCFVLCVSLSSIRCTPSTWLVEFGRC